eukprot:212656-Heterocapsa_arctica.AAC.1
MRATPTIYCEQDIMTERRRPTPTIDGEQDMYYQDMEEQYFQGGRNTEGTICDRRSGHSACGRLRGTGEDRCTEVGDQVF